MAKDVILTADLGGTPLSPAEILAIPDFSKLNARALEKFPGAIAKQTLRQGEILFREGDSGSTAYYILSGEMDLYLSSQMGSAQSKKMARPTGLMGSVKKFTNYLKGVPDREGVPRRDVTHIPMDASVDLPIDKPIATLGPGELFGELAALAAFKQEKIKRPKIYPRSATVRAKTDVEILEILPNILNNVLYNSPAFKDKLNNNYRTRALDNHLRSVPVFAGLSQEFRDFLRQRVELVDFAPGQTIVKQGEVADAFYLIRLGFVKVTQEFAGGDMVLTYLSRGSYFGEIGLLPPVFQVTARGEKPEYRTRVRVGREPVVVGRAPEVDGDGRLETPWDDYISREHFQMVSEGKQVRVTRLPSGKNPITYRMQPADSFLISVGESFLVGNTAFEVAEDSFQTGRRTATCSAMDFVQLVRIKADDFAEMMAQFPEVEQRITEVARARRQMDGQILNRVNTVSLNDFLKQELMQAQNLLLLDLDKCTRCDDCVRGCVATHEDGATRLIREGLRFDKYLVPTSCRACMDPLCMTRCPVGSIRRKESLDIVIEDWCIGCSACAEECPYGNLNIIDLSTLPGQPVKPTDEAKPKAVVCDLCQEYDEPNCVRACPHDAAIRVEPKKFFARELAGIQLTVPVRDEMGFDIPGQLPAAALETRIHSNVADLLHMLPRLKVRSGSLGGSTLQLRYPTTTFGRTAECDYRFADDEGVSRVHCNITGEGGRFLLRDLGSTNGTLVNGNEVESIELRNGDVITIGEIELEFLTGQVQ